MQKTSLTLAYCLKRENVLEPTDNSIINIYPKVSKNFFIIDGHSQLYQAYYAIIGLTTPSGQPINAVYGFTRMLRKIVKEDKPYYMAIAFDSKGPTFRHLEYAKYKEHRKPTPDDLASQIPLMFDLIRAYNIPIFAIKGFEADDIIGTISKKVSMENIECTIITTDKDMDQLVDKHIKVFNPRKKEIRDIDKIRNEMGIEPKNFIDVLALSGDSSDNIPGIPGIGLKTALNLIREWKSLDNVLSNIDRIKGKKKQENLLKYAELARLSMRLATINTEVPIDFRLESCRFTNFNNNKLNELFTAYGFNSFLADNHDSN
ncbi:DNA polymerase I [Candidatus Scalindua japonica]|uniref:DNA polymerase I n=1 Tax=Candidatus Scalindua japonica TaxID=1284222 RepID=A0A286TUD1_9BACT|nr:5'-3' exonuclease H3TH domain-containing protein [Candidatus Scalindua japonica]GAX59497.1 DNA polymerase I [Candidatus Scalindua japonica]